jgi:hypothetical protein
MTTSERDELGIPASLPTPPPAPELLTALRGLEPVATRAPWRGLLAVAALAGLVPGGALLAMPWRPDLRALPRAWVLAIGAGWLVGVIVPLTLAFLPPRGEVLPDGARAGRSAWLVAALLLLMASLFTADVPGLTVLPRTTWENFPRLWWHCVSFALRIIGPALLVGGLALRRVALARPTGLGAALGASAGALAGLALHLICPIGGAAHVGLAHGGAVLIGAALGAPWLAWAVRRANGSIATPRAAPPPG